MIIIDSGEKSFPTEVLDDERIAYKIEEIRIWHCPDEECDRIYTKPGTCDCGEELEYFRVGDITNERRSFVIERKNYQDFYGSVANGTIYKQLDKLSSAFKENASLLFEGNLTKLINENPDRKAQLLSIPATCNQYGVNFLQTQNPHSTAKMLKFFDYKSGKKPKVRHCIHRWHKAKPALVNILMGIKGIGEVTATDIYNRYKNVFKLSIILKTDPNDVLKIKGIGKATLKLLINAFLHE